MIVLLVFVITFLGCSAELKVKLYTISDSCPNYLVTCDATYSDQFDVTEVKAVWLLNGKVLDEEKPTPQQLSGMASYYKKIECDVASFGELTCLVTVLAENDQKMNETSSLDLKFPVTPNITSVEGDKVNTSSRASLKCSAKGYPSPSITWMFEGHVVEESNDVKITIDQDDTSTNATLQIQNTERSNNGTYECRASNSAGQVEKPATLIVLTKPRVTIDRALGIGNGTIFLNWTLNNGNLPILSYQLKYMKEGSNQWQFNRTPLNVTVTSVIIEELEPDESYWLQLEAGNKIGSSGPDKYKEAVRTLDAEPHFKPVVEIKGSTSNSFTLGWNSPPKDIRHLIGHYIASYNAKDGSERQVYVPASEGSPVYLFENLKPATSYLFTIRACNRYTNRCGEPSQSVEGKTLDGVPTEPVNVEMHCERDANNHHVATVKWDPPLEPNGQLVHFTVSHSNCAIF